MSSKARSPLRWLGRAIGGLALGVLLLVLVWLLDLGGEDTRDLEERWP